MRVVSIISQKGGVGKTTLATALAVEADRDGKRALLLDLDPQASASFWSDGRPEGAGPTVTAIPPARLESVHKASDGAGADLVLIDTPPFAKDIAYDAARLADFVLVPARPAVLDIIALTRTVDLIRASAGAPPWCSPFARPLAGSWRRRARPSASSASSSVPSGSAAVSRSPGPSSRGGPHRSTSRGGRPPTRSGGSTGICVYTQEGTEMGTRAERPNALLAAVSRAVPKDGTASGPPAAPDVPSPRKPGSRRPSRAGTRLVAGHFDPKVARQLRVIAAEEDTTVQALLEEALDLLFVRKGRARVRDMSVN